MLSFKNLNKSRLMARFSVFFSKVLYNDTTAVNPPKCKPALASGPIACFMALSIGCIGNVGGSSDFPEIKASELNGKRGFILEGEDEGNRTGSAVGGAGDFNGDGFGDLLITAPYADGTQNGTSGRAYIVFGSGSGFPEVLSLRDSKGEVGLTIDGEDANDRIGLFVSSLGDLNNDGFDDIAIAAPLASVFRGNVYVMFGSLTQRNIPFGVNSLDGTNGFRVTANQPFTLGISVSSGGDNNSDGIMDLAFGTSDLGLGKSHMLFGKQDVFEPTILVSELGANGFSISGSSGSGLGSAVDGRGDFNGDGKTDLVVGLPFADGSESESGRVAVLFGGETPGFESNILSQINGSNGFWIDGEKQRDEFGRTVRFVGDLNSDGFDDVVIGAPFADPNGASSGKAYVIWGTDRIYKEPLDLSDPDAAKYIRILGEQGSNNFFGSSIGGRNDVTGDGIDDFIVGARGAGDSRAGCAYVFFGRRKGYPELIDLETEQGNFLTRICGEEAGDEFGLSVGIADDVNGDSIADIIIGAPKVDIGGLDDVGRSYVMFGSDEEIIFSDSFE